MASMTDSSGHSSLGSIVRVRRSRKADIVTGASSSHNTREQIAMIRPPRERKAMGELARRRLESHDGRWLTRPCWAACHQCSVCCLGPNPDYMGEMTMEEQEDEEAGDKRPQYELKSRRGAEESSIPCLALRQNFCFCCSRTTMSSSEYNNDEVEGNFFFVDMDRFIKFYLSWAFRTSYLKLILNFSMSYFAFIMAFTGMYYGISKQWPMCINSGGGEMVVGPSTFEDCFQLSWETFSTVGYGIIYPSTGASGFVVPPGCGLVGVLGSFEAFLGVLFAGFITSVLFGKVLRSQNVAQVYFSDPMVVRYGKRELGDEVGFVKEAREGIDEESGGLDGTLSLPDQNNIPCPLLEFRLVNRLHDAFRGEIVEAKLKCVAILDPQTSKSKTDASTNSDDAKDTMPDVVNSKTTIAELAQVLQDADLRTANRGLHFHSADSKQAHMFTEVPLEADKHPFFHRVWLGKHLLDENSPLLTPSARHKIKLAGGYWPAELNNYQSIKNCIRFRNLLVCFTGTSNANAANVYAQKVYDLVDVSVGYCFVPMNIKTDKGALQTDPYLLNAIYQQRGGGGEPIGHFV